MNPIDEKQQMVKVRDYILNTYGKDYGIKDSDIGWDGQNVKLGEDVLFKPAYVQDGRSYLDQGSVDSTMQNHFAKTGMQPQSYTQSYNSPYADQIKTMFDQIMNAPAFDPNSIYDTPEYSALESKYQRLGDQAMGNTMGEASAMTGGRLNSWATSAASQAKNSYNQQFTDLIPQMQNNARNAYNSEMSQRMSILDMLQGMDSTEYNRFADDRDFDYGMEQDEQNWDYTMDRDAVEDGRYNTEWAYGMSQDELDEAWRQKEWAYKVKQDELDRALSYARLNNSGGPSDDNDDDGPAYGEIFTLAKNAMLKEDDPWKWIENNYAYLRQAMGPDVIMKLKALIPESKLDYNYSGNKAKEAFKTKQLE
ncbi:MAG: hypothetical protein GT601_06055 [Acidaminobacter sp.]|uniref:hypothetical protein n=1 Tax=Acidaminobacter sp. TaxID=1872102 RepID=UPI00137CE8C1|nr:hypothetical protein [Acidaminobacter sp.]MZQ97219.1 hypothetical protein [Acidaminobacter sp.]